MARGRFRWEEVDLFDGCREANTRIDNMISRVTDYWATQGEAYAKSNAPWRDRTSNARNGLFTTPFHVPYRHHGFVIAHGVPYGIWLEVRQSGRNAIIVPTMDHVMPQMLTMIARRWGPAMNGGSQ